MSINIYRIGKTVLDDTQKSIKYSLNIDPGINTGGITMINHLTGCVDIVSYQGDYDAMESQYPKLFCSVSQAVESYLSLIGNSMDKLDIPISGMSDMEITIEYTGTWGQYSIGLFTFLSAFHTRLMSNDIRGLTLVPPLVGKYFLFEKYKENLRQQKSDTDFDVKKLINLNTINVSKTELKRLVEIEFPDIIPKKYFKAKDKVTKLPKWKFDHTNHMADSLLMGVFRHYDYFKEKYPRLSLKKPDYNLIELISN